VRDGEKWQVVPLLPLLSPEFFETSHKQELGKKRKFKIKIKEKKEARKIKVSTRK